MRLLTLITALLILGASTFAQEPETPLSAENVRELKQSRVVRYTDMLPASSEETPLPLSGWFTLSPDGTKAAFVLDGGVRITHIADGSLPDTVLMRDGVTVIDAHWSDDSAQLAMVYLRETEYMLWVWHDPQVSVMAIPVSGVPVRVWFDAENAGFVWIEVTPAPEDPDRSGFQVARLDLTADDGAPLILPTGPEHDFDSFVRIGRIPAPLAITATFANTVRRWSLQTGEVTAEVELPLAPTFGRVNETNGIDFAWRDESSEGLHLLNFETAEDRFIAPLHGEYIQALLLSPDASVILAVHRGESPTITAWLTATGEEIALGEYDTSICSRVPDMVQLARNGSRLVIGCDTGYQVWEIAAD